MPSKYTFDFPSNNNIANNDGGVTLPWLQAFQRWHTVIASEQQSGTTAQRPIKGLWVGRRYFDTTLGYPVYLKSVNPSVWVNGAGTVV